MRNRFDIQQMIPAELKIFEAMQEIEKLGADTRLTDAQLLLDKAKNLVGDYIDNPKKTALEHIESMTNIDPEILRTPFGNTKVESDFRKKQKRNDFIQRVGGNIY